MATADYPVACPIANSVLVYGSVIPAKAGIQLKCLDTRIRGCDMMP